MSTYSENATRLTTIKVYLPFLTVCRASVVCRSNACLHLHPRLRISNSQNLHTVPGGNWVSAPQHFQNFGPDLAKHLCVWGTSGWKRSHRLHWMLLETKSHSSTLCGARCLMLRGGTSQGPSRLTTRLSSNCQSVKMKKKKQRKKAKSRRFVHPPLGTAVPSSQRPARALCLRHGAGAEPGALPPSPAAGCGQPRSEAAPPGKGSPARPRQRSAGGRLPTARQGDKGARSPPACAEAAAAGPGTPGAAVGARVPPLP